MNEHEKTDIDSDDEPEPESKRLVVDLDGFASARHISYETIMDDYAHLDILPIANYPKLKTRFADGEIGCAGVLVENVFVPHFRMVFHGLVNRGGLPASAKVADLLEYNRICDPEFNEAFEEALNAVASEPARPKYIICHKEDQEHMAAENPGYEVHGLKYGHLQEVVERIESPHPQDIIEEKYA